ncbi:MAG TPA: beta-eliminating lyase-related protein, partial [Elusimicrobiales bacterium]|nr:beta-eliminating lyase-related protein [Elusimicrobiales bacterium]
MKHNPPAFDFHPKTIIEPFRIKMVEPLGFTTCAQRKSILKKAHYNLFNIRAEHVIFDFLTDSGTGSMSSEQWAGIMRGDESYAGAKSFYEFKRSVQELTGFHDVIPVHQGRAAERILFSFVGGEGKIVVSNSHFDTTRANVEHSGAQAVDLPAPGALNFAKSGPFKGNMDISALQAFIKKHGSGRIALCVMTVTNNSLGGQPVSMGNLREVYS